MNRKFLSILLTATLVLSACAQTVPVSPAMNENTNTPVSTTTNSASVLKSMSNIPAVTEEVEYFGTAKGFFAQPAATGSMPGIILIHEWWGLNQQIKDVASELAKEGYLVLAVDLYNGKVATTADEARAMVSSLDQAAALKNMQAALQFLKDKGATKLASWGWCFGGGQSMQLALSGQKLDATVIYYGNLVTDAAQLKKINWPVLGIFGDKDTSIPPATVQEFEKALNADKITNNITIYPGVGHAFANPSGANYAPNETKDAWEKTLKFLAEQLKNNATAKPSTKHGDESTPSVKTFNMDSFMKMNEDGSRVAGFSLKDISVKKGDTVRVNVNNLKGTHDFVIDEFGVQQDTPEGQVTTIEFKADKAGTFQYYCSKYNHRSLGQWGTLTVEE